MAPVAALLHVDSSAIVGDESTSRAVTAAFRAAWLERIPAGTVLYRDLALHPIPHISADACTAGSIDPAARTPQQAAGRCQVERWSFHGA